MMVHDLRRTVGLVCAAAMLGVAPASMVRAADGATIAEQCAECHGRNGASSDSSIPIIGGYSVKYIVESLNNFRKKARACTEVTIPAGPKKGRKSDMCKVVADLSEDDARTVAKYLSAQKFVRAKQPFDAAKAKQGSSVYSLRCKKCHDDNGSSPDEDNGILAGQWTPYLRLQLEVFRAGKRPIDEKMKARLDRVNKDEEEALLHFFASQQ
jgi:cytochrome subunit of sulfide dehydrogenase